MYGSFSRAGLATKRSLHHLLPRYVQENQLVMNRSISRVLNMMVDYYCQPNPNLYHKDAVLRTLRELQSVTDAGRKMTDTGKDF